MVCRHDKLHLALIFALFCQRVCANLSPTNEIDNDNEGWTKKKLANLQNVVRAGSCVNELPNRE